VRLLLLVAKADKHKEQLQQPAAYLWVSVTQMSNRASKTAQNETAIWRLHNGREYPSFLIQFPAATLSFFPSIFSPIRTRGGREEEQKRKEGGTYRAKSRRGEKKR
jgi:hypothetical protein